MVMRYGGNTLTYSSFIDGNVLLKDVVWTSCLL
jgi:hypothetical protein